jgi:hypothetical protein
MRSGDGRIERRNGGTGKMAMGFHSILVPELIFRSSIGIMHPRFHLTGHHRGAAMATETMVFLTRPLASKDIPLSFIKSAQKHQRTARVEWAIPGESQPTSNWKGYCIWALKGVRRRNNRGSNRCTKDGHIHGCSFTGRGSRVQHRWKEFWSYDQFVWYTLPSYHSHTTPA